MSFLPTPPSEPASRHENAPKAKDSTVWIPSTWDEGVSLRARLFPPLLLFKLVLTSLSISLSDSSFQATTHAQAIFGRVILRDEIPEAEALALCDGIGEFKRRKREGKVQPELIPSFFFDFFFTSATTLRSHSREALEGSQASSYR